MKQLKSPTFAPPSFIKDLSAIIRPQKGPLVQVIVAWRDRVLNVYHFKNKGVITFGSDSRSDVVVAGLTGAVCKPLLRLCSKAKIFISSGTEGRLWRANGSETHLGEMDEFRLAQLQNRAQELSLAQGEMVRIDLERGHLSLYVRYAEGPSRVALPPTLHLMSSEVAGVVSALTVVALLGLQTRTHSPPQEKDDGLLERPLRQASIVFQAPQPPRPPSSSPVRPITNQHSEQGQPISRNETLASPGSSSSSNSGNVRGESSQLEGESQSPVLDVNKEGILGVFGKGVRNSLGKVHTGSREVTAMANQAMGTSSQAEEGFAKSSAGRLKDAGVSGAGASIERVSGLGTTGRSQGDFGYGRGGHLGERGRIRIQLPAGEAEFSPLIDREAIRKVIVDNRRAIRFCYENQLNRNPELYGKILLAWEIDDRGQVIRGNVDFNSMADREVANCALKHIKTLRFPPMPTGKIGAVRFPFVFQSE